MCMKLSNESYNEAFLLNHIQLIILFVQVVLKSKFTNNITNERKKSIWESITSAVNAVNCGERKTVEQVRTEHDTIIMSGSDIICDKGKITICFKL